MRRNRVRNRDFVTFDIHDRVNYAVEEAHTEISDDRKVFTLLIKLDTQISSVMDYFEIFLGRMLLCRKAAEKLGMQFKLTVNGQEALDSTAKLLAERGLSDRARLLLDSHSNMENYAEPETVDCITFNFGWLPAGNHSIFTTPATSIPAIEAGLRLLKPGGIMSLCIYYGRDCGFTERDALLEYLPTIDSKIYTVIVSQFCNRPNNPPIPVFIWKDA